MGGQLDELLASLAARCRVCYYVRMVTMFMLLLCFDVYTRATLC